MTLKGRSKELPRIIAFVTEQKQLSGWADSSAGRVSGLQAQQPELYSQNSNEKNNLRTVVCAWNLGTEGGKDG